MKNLLLAVAKHELEIEQLRLSLAHAEAFEPYATYRLMDSINKKHIVKEDVMFFCMEQPRMEQLLDVDAEAFIEAMDLEGKGHLDIHK